MLNKKLKFERDKLKILNLGKAQSIFFVFLIKTSNSSIELTVSLFAEAHEII